MVTAVQLMVMRLQLIVTAVQLMVTDRQCNQQYLQPIHSADGMTLKAAYCMT